MNQRGPRGKLHNLKYLNQTKRDFSYVFYGGNQLPEHSESKEKEEELL